MLMKLIRLVPWDLVVAVCVNTPASTPLMLISLWEPSLNLLELLVVTLLDPRFAYYVPQRYTRCD